MTLAPPLVEKIATNILFLIFVHLYLCLAQPTKAIISVYICLAGGPHVLGCLARPGLLLKKRANFCL